MLEEKVYPLKKHPYHFISHKGYVFFVSKSREIECNRHKNKYGRIIVHVEDKEYDLVLLMLEYFYPKYNSQDHHYFTHDPSMRVHAKGISFKKCRASELSLEDETKMRLWKCSMKAGSANSRSTSKITARNVYDIFILADFRCIYCGDNLYVDDWHLDHFYALSESGKNSFKNLAPSCKRCNTMKSTLSGFAFIRQCKKVVLNHLLDKRDVTLSDEADKEFEDFVNSDILEKQ